ncbi:hypothetical protein HK107_00915 [Parvularcula sp. ZS-1/3]|uniref:Uncharacterized protein n=1 Tax=Parvularcula mediterranea TaxID=2732508 RepID=A0A7Y3RIW4_9PROT|nr:hypothetical protein [Parvularcula mediterranea]NNU14882.1 hypothetical protein [Parvularcula mediterranea]
MLASFILLLTSALAQPAPVPSAPDAESEPFFRECMALRLEEGDIARIVAASEELPSTTWQLMMMRTPCVFVGGVELDGQRLGYS